jgi:hypothetical protein
MPGLFLIFLYFITIYNRTWFNNYANPIIDWDHTPMFLFIVVFIVISVAAWMHRLSLIPILGILSCLYLMAQIHVKNWVGFLVWLAAGLIIYFGYGYRRSKLNK